MIELFKIATKYALRRRKRTILTMLGIFVGIAAVVALVSLGQGLQKMINETFEEFGADKIIIQAKEFGFTGKDAPGQLTERDLDVVGRVLGVKRSAGMLSRAAQVEFNDVQRTRFMLSIPDDAEEADLMIKGNLMKPEQGRLLTHRDRGKVMVGYNIGHKKEFRKNVRIGNKLVIEGETFDVVGIMEHVGDPAMDVAVVLAEEDVRRLSGEQKGYSYFFAQIAKGAGPEAVAERIERAMRRDRNLDEGKEDFSVQTSAQLVETFGTVLLLIQAVFVGIAAISLLVGGIGIMNTMYTSVLERTGDIGVMKAIGARNSEILGLFLMESGLLGLAGGAVGVLIGMGISKLVESAVNFSFGPGTIMAAFPLYLVVGALAFSFVVGAVSGVLPAYRASKLSPVDALRYE